MDKMDIERPYLMLLNIRDPQPEHAQIQRKLTELSGGTSKAVYFDKNGGAFLFMSKLVPRQIYDRFSGILLNDDTYIIVELGDKWITFGHGSASGWLHSHLKE